MKFANLQNERGKLVIDGMRPDTFADYFERMVWVRNNEIDQQQQEYPASIYDIEAEVKQYHFTKEELDRAITRLRSNKTPGPNRVTSEPIKLLDEEGRDKLLDLLNKCWAGEHYMRRWIRQVSQLYTKRDPQTNLKTTDQ